MLEKYHFSDNLERVYIYEPKAMKYICYGSYQLWDINKEMTLKEKTKTLENLLYSKK